VILVFAHMSHTPWWSFFDSLALNCHLSSETPVQVVEFLFYLACMKYHGIDASLLNNTASNHTIRNGLH
jgi:hypothetical protein